MEPFGSVFVFSVVVAALVLAALLARTPMTTAVFEDGVERVQRELGAQFPGRRRGSGARAHGTIGDATLAITADASGDPAAETYTELVVAMEGPRIPREISFAKEGGVGQDVLTGDPYFDDTVAIHGEPSLVLALLDEDLRQKIAAFVSSEGSLRSGRLLCRAPAGAPQAQIPSLVRMTVELAEALSAATKGAIAPRLARHAKDDPLPEVRRLNLLQLHDRYMASRETLAASRAALADTDPWVRLAGARFLRAEVATLEPLARDRQVPDQAASEAVALLAARLTPERAGPLLVEILKLRAGDTQRQAVVELGRLRHGPAFGPLVVVMERSAPRTAAAAAAALAALGDPRAETRLLGMLGREDADLRVAAARALGELGTVASVAPLLALAESRGLDAIGRQNVRRAIAAIQSRLVGAGVGQLSVASAASESGRLSLTGDQAGALSLADEPETAGPAGDAAKTRG